MKNAVCYKKESWLESVNAIAAEIQRISILTGEVYKRRELG
jgi:hypothetical protein